MPGSTTTVVPSSRIRTTVLATRSSAYPAVSTCSSAVMASSWHVPRGPWPAFAAVRRSELHDPQRDPVRRGHAAWVVQVHGGIQGSLGSGPYCGARIRGDEVDAEPGDHGVLVVVVQAFEGKAVVEQGRRLEEHLAGHLRIDLRARLDDGLCGR